MKLLNKKIKFLRVWWDGGGMLVASPRGKGEKEHLRLKY
jgi:hypothetical protein